MPHLLDYRHIFPRQQNPQTTVLTTTGLGGQTTVVSVFSTVTSLELGTTPVPTTPHGGPTSTAGSSSTSSTTPTESAAPAPQTIPTPTLAGICVAAGVILAGVIIFVLYRSKKKPSDQPPLEGFYSQDASTHDMKLRRLSGVYAAPPPPISSFPRPSTVTTAYDHGYQGGKAGYEHDVKQSFDAVLPPARGSNYTQEEPFLPLRLTEVDTGRPQTASPSSDPQSPRSASAQPITHPYSVGSHPYASPYISHAPLHRPSFERTATSTTAIAAANPESLARLGQSTSGFAGAGARPGYDAYGFESRNVGATSSNSVVNRPSIESIRGVARKASLTNVPPETTYPPAGSISRPRNNSTSSSVRAAKLKPTREEKAREMAAMDHLIAALDENADAERRRKELLVAAAGIGDGAPNSSKKSTGSSRRKDTAITGSYPLPSSEVFRAALSGGRVDDEPDDEEIERWRKH